MKQCINCLSNNIKTVAIKDRLFYYCKDCEFKSERVINNDGDVYTRKENGMIKHITVAALIIKENKILMLDRKRFPFGLSLPTGHLLNNENVSRTLKRTLLNKTGLSVIEKKLILNESIFDSCKYWGEVHEWFVYDCETKGDTTAGEDKIVWVELKNLEKAKIVESSREILSLISLVKNKQRVHIAKPSTSSTKNPTVERSSHLLSHEITYSIMEDLSTPVIATDIEGNIIYKNKHAVTLIEKIDQTNNSNDLEPIKFHSILTDLVNRAVKSNYTVSSNFKTSNNTFNIVLKPLHNKDQIIGCSATLYNVTDQKQKEARDVLAYRTSLAVCSNSNYLSIIKTVLKQMFYSMDIVGSSLMTLEGDKLKITFRYSKIDHKKRAPLVLKLGEGVAGWVARNKTILAIPDTSKDPLYVGSAIKEEKSILSVPVMYNNEVYGVLNISKKSNDFFSEEEIKMVEIVANRIALAFENEKLHRQTIQEKNILEQVLTNTTDGIALIDDKFEVIINNTYFKKLYGLEESYSLRALEALKSSLSEDDFNLLVEKISQSMHRVRTETLEICSNDRSRIRYLKVTVSPFIEKSPKCDKALVVINDITDQKDKQKLIERQFEQISSLFEISSVISKQNSLLHYLKSISKIEEITAATLGSASKIIIFSEGKGRSKALNPIQKNISKYADGYISNSYNGEINKIVGVKTKINNIIMASVGDGTNIFGLIFAFNREAPFSRSDLSWLKLVGTRTGLKIQSLKLLEQTQYESEQLSRIVSNTADGIIVTHHKDGQIHQILWNNAMTRLTGYHSVHEYFQNNPTREAKYRKLLLDAKNKNSNDGMTEEMEISNSSGEKVWLGVRFSFFTFHNEVYLVSVIRDFSRQKQIETQQKEFVYTATHELRTPLTIINGYLSMILGGDAGNITEKQLTYFTRVKIATERIINLVEELLKVARLEEKRVEFERKPFDSSKIFDEIKGEFSEKAKAKKLEFVVNPNIIAKSSILLGDFHKTKEAISNIVDNAIKYTKKGCVTVDYRENDELGTIIIKDTGVGIHPKDQANVFKKFIRVSNSESVKAGGTGLGLYIVKNLIEQQGGHIRLESNLGEGSIFFVDLPKANIKSKTK